LVIATALSALLLTAGCGGGDSATGAGSTEVSVETGSLSKAEFIKKTDAICAATLQEFRTDVLSFMERAMKNPPKPTEPAPELTIVSDLFVPTFQKEIEKISAQGAPSGDEQEITAFLTELQEAVNSADEEPEGFAEAGFPIGAEARKLAKAYGLSRFCAEVPQ
jgi:hypothetical protein